jgi:hypothetical protein
MKLMFYVTLVSRTLKFVWKNTYNVQYSVTILVHLPEFDLYFVHGWVISHPFTLMQKPMSCTFEVPIIVVWSKPN